jgi:hypothetical protein
MYLVCAGPLSDCPSHLVMSSYPLSLSSYAPRIIEQLYLALLEVVSGSKLCYLHGPATPCWTTERGGSELVVIGLKQLCLF